MQINDKNIIFKTAKNSQNTISADNLKVNPNSPTVRIVRFVIRQI